MAENNKMAVADSFARKVMVVSWDGKSPTATVDRNVTSFEENIKTNVLDFAGVDPKGRLVTGTYRFKGCVRTPDPNAAVYVVELNGQIVPIINDIATIAGLAWNKRKRLMYFFDSCTYTIFEYRWSPKDGTVCKS